MGLISELDIYIHPDLVPEIGQSATRLKNALLHELGHAHMLNHNHNENVTFSNQSIMLYSLDATATTLVYSPQPDDVAGANLLFDKSDRIEQECGVSGIGKSGNCGGNCLSTSTENVDGIGRDNLYVIPNPVRAGNDIHFDYITASIIKMELYDINGRLIQQWSQVKARDQQVSCTIDRDVLAGLYFIQIIYHDRIQTIPLLIH